MRRVSAELPPTNVELFAVKVIPVKYEAVEFENIELLTVVLPIAITDELTTTPPSNVPYPPPELNDAEFTYPVV